MLQNGSGADAKDIENTGLQTSLRQRVQQITMSYVINKDGSNYVETGLLRITVH
jgi:hypothetical protein